MKKKKLLKLLSLFNDDDEIAVGIKWDKEANYYSDACMREIVYTVQNGCMNATLSFMETGKPKQEG